MNIDINWKFLGINLVCIMLGMFAGMQMKAEAQAEAIAKERCGTCQENLGIMVSNFNTLAKQCKEAQDNQIYRDIPTLIGNKTVRVYVPA